MIVVTQPAVLGTKAMDLLLENPGFLRMDREGWPVTVADRLLTPRLDAAMVALETRCGSYAAVSWRLGVRLMHIAYLDEGVVTGWRL